MPTHAEKKELPHTPEQMFALVADIESYPEFLPWCLEARIWKRENNIVYADLVIGYKMFRERFTSKVTLNAPGHIHVEYMKGPLKHLSNHWRFLPSNPTGHPNACIIDFFVDFEFKNPVFQKVMGVFFNEAVRRMVSAFEARAKALH